MTVLIACMVLTLLAAVSTATAPPGSHREDLSSLLTMVFFTGVVASFLVLVVTAAT